MHTSNFPDDSFIELENSPYQICYLPRINDEKPKLEVITSNDALVQINLSLETSPNATTQTSSFAAVTLSQYGKDQIIAAPTEEP